MHAFVCRSFSAPDLAVDFGTANLRVWSTTSGVAEVPSRVGNEEASTEPLRAGVIVDGDGAARLLHAVFRRLRTWHARPPRVLATVPGDASEEERVALVSALRDAGADAVAIVPEPVAAAVGCGLVDASGEVRMIVDVGEGVTEVAVLSRGLLLHRDSIRLACSDMRDCVQIAAAGLGVRLSREDADAIVASNDATLPYATAVAIAAETIAEFVRNVYRDLDSRTRRRIERSGGVCLTGGGSLVATLRRAVETQLELPISVPRDPLHAVIAGSRRLLDGEAAHVWAGFAEA